MAERIDVEGAAKAAFKNRDALGATVSAGCYSCLRTFATSEIREWTDGGQTALCPICDTDAVVPGQHEEATLAAMCERWFCRRTTAHTLTSDQLVRTLRVVSGLIGDAINGAQGTTLEVLAHAHEAIATTLMRVPAAIEKLEELEATFDLRWKADMRAIKRWQQAHPGNELVWPDHTDLCVWLLEQLDKHGTPDAPGGS